MLYDRELDAEEAVNLYATARLAGLRDALRAALWKWHRSQQTLAQSLAHWKPTSHERDRRRLVWADQTLQKDVTAAIETSVRIANQ